MGMRTPSNRILKNSVTIFPGTSKQDAVGAPTWTYGSPSAIGVATSVQYREAGLDAESTRRLTPVFIYHVFFAFNPGLKPRDKLVQTDISPNRTLFVDVNPPSEAGRGGCFVLRCIEKN